MKLTNIHMIIILVCAIIFSALFGSNTVEGLQNKNPNSKGYKNQRRRRRREKKQQQIFSADALSEPPGTESYKKSVVDHYNNNKYNNPVTNDSDSDYENGGQWREVSDSGTDSGTDSDSDTDDTQQNYRHHRQNERQMASDIYPSLKQNVPFQPPMSQTQDYPTGITSDQIPDGDEDLYILKSQIVPPVCPACPTVTECPSSKPPRPCPPCARCPEPDFTCKKVPNYKRVNSNIIPVPMLNDFSQF